MHVPYFLHEISILFVLLGPPQKLNEAIDGLIGLLQLE
jgi:hypothetical protein